MAATGHPVVSPPIGVVPEITIRADSRVRADHARRGVVVHVVQGVRRDLPGEHRDPRQDPRHAALPVAHGVELPHRARQRVPVDGEPSNPWGMSQGERGGLGTRSSTTSSSSTAAKPLEARVPLLGRLRRIVRRQEPQGHPSNGEAARTRRHRLRHPRAERALHGRPGSTVGQRVHLPDARHAEHRDARTAWA